MNPTIAVLKIIKDELAKIDSDINLQGGIKSVVIKDLVKALSVAVSFIDSCTPNENGDTCHEHLGDVANDAYYAAKQIANILSGEKDGK